MSISFMNYKMKTLDSFYVEIFFTGGLHFLKNIMMNTLISSISMLNIYLKKTIKIVMAKKYPAKIRMARINNNIR